MIDKKIFYVWFGGKPIPDEDKRCMDTWAEMCPDYEIIRIDENTYDLSANPAAARFYERKIWAFAASAARFDVLSKNSGFYLDTDVKLLRSLDCLREMPSFVVKHDEKFVPEEVAKNGRFLLNNAFLGSNTDKTIFSRCMESLKIAEAKAIPPAQAMNELLLADNPSLLRDDQLEVFGRKCAYLPQSALILEGMEVTKWTIGIHYANISWKQGLAKWRNQRS